VERARSREREKERKEGGRERKRRRVDAELYRSLLSFARDITDVPH